MIEGSYGGNSNVTHADYVLGTSRPKSKIANIGWMMSYVDNSDGTADTATYNLTALRALV